MIPHLSLDVASDLIARLDALPGALSQSILVEALKTGAEPMRAREAELAPRGSHEIKRPDRAEGHLADHIVISNVRKVDGETLIEGQAAVAVGPSKDYWWGGFSEFGTFHEPARAFARPAFDETEAIVFDTVTAQIWIRLREAAERGFGAGFAGASGAGTGAL